MKIVIHVQIEIDETGTIRLGQASWTPTQRPPRGGPLQVEEITAIAQAVVRRTVRSEPEQFPDGGEPLPTPPEPLQLDVQPPARGNFLVSPLGKPGDLFTPPAPSKAHGPPIRNAIGALVAVGVTAHLAKELAQTSGTARACEVAAWMRDKTDVRNADALARRMLAKAGPAGQ